MISVVEISGTIYNNDKIYKCDTIIYHNQAGGMVGADDKQLHLFLLGRAMFGYVPFQNKGAHLIIPVCTKR